MYINSSLSALKFLTKLSVLSRPPCKNSITYTSQKYLLLSSTFMQHHYQITHPSFISHTPSISLILFSTLPRHLILHENGKLKICHVIYIECRSVYPSGVHSINDKRSFTIVKQWMVFYILILERFQTYIKRLFSCLFNSLLLYI